MVSHFLQYLSSEKRYSAHTLRSYSQDLKDFETFLLKTEGDTAWQDISARMIKNFVYSLGEAGVSKRTINRKISCLRSFFKYLLKLGEIQKSPAEAVSTLKFYPTRQIPFSEDEMDAAADVSIPDDPRKKLIIELLYQTGMRKAELCDLTIEQFDATAGQLRIRGKGNKDRIVPISAALRDSITEHLQSQTAEFPDAIHLICNKKGGRLNEKFVYSTVNGYLSNVTSKTKKSPHMLRHTFATHLLNNGAEITTVKDLMGHSSLASTQVYTHANIEQLKKVFAAAHPRANQSDTREDEETES